MAVFRVDKNRNYTVMSNYHLRDTNMSLKAIGLLSKMLSLADEWDYTTRGLAAICKERCTNGAGVQPAASGGGYRGGKIPRRAIRQTADRPSGDVPGNQKSVGGRRADSRTGGGCSWRLTHNFFQMGSQRRDISLSRRSKARVKISMLIFSPETLAIFHQSWYNETSK